MGKLDVKDVLSFRARNFVAPNVTVIGNGLGADQLEKLASGISSGSAAISESPYVGGVVRRRVDAGGRLHTAVAFPAATGQKGNAKSNYSDHVFQAKLSLFFKMLSKARLGVLLMLLHSLPTMPLVDYLGSMSLPPLLPTVRKLFRASSLS